MRLVITKKGVGRWAADYIKFMINVHQSSNERNFVLGLPTGSTPLAMYQSLIDMYRNGDVSFKRVTTFNMDEYIGLPVDHKEAYHTYMYKVFFDHVDIDPANIHLLNGNASDLAAECHDYELSMAACGGVDLFVGGVGENGHIAFNEPYSSFSSVTRSKHLGVDTRIVNSRFFNNDISQVPERALTVGIKTLLDSRQVLILVSGVKKTLALKQCIEGAMTHACPITALQLHPQAVIIADEEACSELTVKTYRYFSQIKDKYSEVEAM